MENELFFELWRQLDKIAHEYIRKIDKIDIEKLNRTESLQLQSENTRMMTLIQLRDILEDIMNNFDKQKEKQNEQNT